MSSRFSRMEDFSSGLMMDARMQTENLFFFFWKTRDLELFFLTNVYRSDAFENPVIQMHFRNLEALALDMMAPEDIEDLISNSNKLCWFPFV